MNDSHILPPCCACMCLSLQIITEMSVETKPQTLQGLAFPLQAEAKHALQQLAKKHINYIQLVRMHTCTTIHTFLIIIFTHTSPNGHEFSLKGYEFTYQACDLNASQWHVPALCMQVSFGVWSVQTNVRYKHVWKHSVNSLTKKSYLVSKLDLGHHCLQCEHSSRNILK